MFLKGETQLSGPRVSIYLPQHFSPSLREDEFWVRGRVRRVHRFWTPTQSPDQIILKKKKIYTNRRSVFSTHQSVRKSV